MAHCHFTLDMIYDYRLRIKPVIVASSTVSCVPNRHIAVSEAFKHIGCKYIVYKTYVLVIRKYAVVVYNYTAALLSAMLKRKQTVIGRARNRR